MAREDPSSCQAVRGELQLQQKQAEDSVLQELTLGTAKVQQEVKVIFTKTMEGFGEQTGKTSGKGLVLYRLCEDKRCLWGKFGSSLCLLTGAAILRYCR